MKEGIIGYPTIQQKKDGVFSNDSPNMIKEENLDIFTETFQRQSTIESKIADFAFEQTLEKRYDFVKTLHMFFSPFMIPDGLTIEQARLLYIIALHYKTKFGGSTLPQIWLCTQINEKDFMIGLEEFMKKTLKTGGSYPKDSPLAKLIIKNKISEPDSEGMIKIAEFI